MARARKNNAPVTLASVAIIDETAAAPTTHEIVVAGDPPSNTAPVTIDAWSGVHYPTAPFVIDEIIAEQPAEGSQPVQVIEEAPVSSDAAPEGSDVTSAILVTSEEIDEAIATIDQADTTAEVYSEQAASDVTVSAEPADPVQSEAIRPTLEQLLEAVEQVKVEAISKATGDALDNRADFEFAKNPDNENIQKTIKKARAQMVSWRAARLMAVAAVSPEFLNREIHGGARYNVYAIGKLADLIYGATGGAVKNAINLACLKSLFRFRKAGIVFTGEAARAAASNKLAKTLDVAARGCLVSHDVSASTAPTQASSTMSALEILGIVKRSGTVRAPIYDLTDSPLTARFEEMMLAA